MEKIEEYKKRFFENNPDYQKKWREARRQGKKYSIKTFWKMDNLNYKKNYYEKNREKLQEYQRTYRNKHREKIKELKKKYLRVHPYIKTMRNIRYRCNNPNDKKWWYYGGKGIKCFLTTDKIRMLWERDFANLMRHPSIDRINSNENYTFENCRFIEMSENRKHYKPDSECSPQYIKTALYKKRRSLLLTK